MTQTLTQSKEVRETKAKAPETKGTLIQQIWLHAKNSLEKIKTLLSTKEGKEKVSSGGLIGAALFFIKTLTRKHPLQPKDNVSVDDKNAKENPEEVREVEDLSDKPKETEKCDEMKVPTIEDLAKIPDKGERILRIVDKMVTDKVKAKHCWDWVQKVYTAAGVKRKGVFSSFNKYEGKDCGEHHADEAMLNRISPGDHIFINNKNKWDKYGNHSVIFIKWVSRKKKIAKLAGFPGGSRPPVIYNRSLNSAPVTFIAKPK